MVIRVGTTLAVALVALVLAPAVASAQDRRIFAAAVQGGSLSVSVFSDGRVELAGSCGADLSVTLLAELHSSANPTRTGDHVAGSATGFWRLADGAYTPFSVAFDLQLSSEAVTGTVQFSGLPADCAHWGDAALAVTLPYAPPPPDVPLPPGDDSSPAGPCSVAYLKAHPAFATLLREAVRRFRKDGLGPLLRGRGRLRSILACETGRIEGRVVEAASGKVVGTGRRKLSFSSVGRVTVDLKLKRAAKRRLRDAERVKLRVTIRVFDASGASIRSTRVVTLER